MKTFHFHDKLWLPHPRPAIFQFFSDAFNLEKITPPFLKFHVVTAPPIRMQEGVEIEYRLKIHGIPARWRSRITVWDPPNRFVDEQLHGPYRLWIHEHRFAEDAGGTTCEHSVEYAPLGGTIINKLLVERDVRQIFAYRAERLKDMYGLPPVTGPQKVA
ncbi:MAG: SRPBCC family protein [Candidatus Acidiferrales bacterium]|jgi:ligand-binding SRPBCC domain-containing protein